MSMPTSGPQPIRILIVDDHAIMREGLRMLIENRPGMVVVGEGANRVDALAAAAREHPDVILLDLDLGGDMVLDCIPELLAASGGARVLILTGVRNPDLHRQAVRQGAMGLVLKEKATEVLLQAIEKVNAGEVWLERVMMASVLDQMRRGPEQPSPEAARIATLTPREIEVIPLICEGLKNREIARRLFISEVTVRHHLRAIFAKLEVTDRLELLIYAYRHGLARPSP